MSLDSKLLAVEYETELMADVDALIALALREDVGQGDITSQLLIDDSAQATLHFRNREPITMAGGFLVQRVYAHLGVACRVEQHQMDGERIEAAEELITVSGHARGLLTGERVALNLLQRACGVATHTQSYVQAVQGSRAMILDTRKTMPGMRLLDKYAVRCGGGHNHRLRLDDRILIKDNHIALAGSVGEVIAKAKRGNARGVAIEVECETVAQVQEALAHKVDWIMLDNMTPDQVAQTMRSAHGDTLFEASGGITLQNVAAMAQTGVDAISVGAITHSAPAVDIGLDCQIESAV